MRKTFIILVAALLLPLASLRAQTDVDCATITDDEIPFFEDFETLNSDLGDPFLDCWTRIMPTALGNADCSASSTKPSPSTGASNNKHCYIIAGDEPDEFVYVVLPRFENVTDKMVKLYLMHGNAHSFMDLGVMTDPDDASTFDSICSFVPAPATNATAAWTYFEHSLASYADTGHYIALRARSDLGGYDIRLDELTVDFAPTCTRATDVVFDDITTTSATLRVIDSTHVNSYNVTLTPDGGESQYIFLEDSELELTGLTPGTDYEVEFTTSCPYDGTETTPIIVVFRTRCDMLTHDDLPIYFDMDSLQAAGQFNAMCWEKHYGGYAPIEHMQPSISTTHRGDSGLSLRMEPGSAGYKQFVVLPEIDSINDLYIEFYTRGAYEISLALGAMTDPFDTTTFTQLYYIPSILSDEEWDRHVVFLDSYTAGGRYIAFRATQVGVFSGTGVNIDDITIDRIPTCAAPVAVTVTGIGQTEATINIVDTAATSVYELVITADDGSTTTEYVYEESFQYYDGVPGGHYTVSVRAICDDGEYTAAVQTQFAMLCEPDYGIPINYTFESQSDLDCWLIESYNGYSPDDWRRESYGDGGWCMTSPHGSSQYASDEWLISPPITLGTGTGYFLSFDYESRAYIANLPRMELRVSTTHREDTTQFSTLLMADNNANLGQTYNVSLDDYAGQTIYLAFVKNSTNDNGVFISNLAVRNVTQPEVEIIAPPSASTGEVTTIIGRLIVGDEVGYTWFSSMIERGDAEKESGEGDTICIRYNTTGIDTITLIVSNGYAEDTAVVILPVYDCRVGTSVLPWSEDCEGLEHSDNGPVAPDCWIVYGFRTDAYGNPYYPNVTTSSAHSGSQALVVTSASGTNTAFFLLPPFEASLDTLQFSVYAQAPSATSMLEIGYMTSTVAPSTFHAVESYTVGSTWQQYTARFPEGTMGRIAIRMANANTLRLDDFVVDIVSPLDTVPPPQPEPCVAVAGVVVSEVSATSARIDWTPAADESQWTVRVSAASIASSTVTATAHPYTLDNLQPQTTYQVEIGIACEDGTTLFSQPTTFTTLQQQGIAETEATAAITLHPNPATTAVEISGLKSGATIELCDMNGRTLLRHTADGASVSIALGSLQPGAYFVRIATAEGTAVRKLIVR